MTKNHYFSVKRPTLDVEFYYVFDLIRSFTGANEMYTI